MEYLIIAATIGLIAGAIQKDHLDKLKKDRLESLKFYYDDLSYKEMEQEYYLSCIY